MRRVMARFSCFWALAVLPAALILIPFEQAKAQFVVSEPVLETNSFVNDAKQIMQYIQEAQTALNTFQHLMVMEREVQQLVTHPSTNIMADLSMVSGIISSSQGLAMNLAQLSTQFNNQFSPYSYNPVVNYAAQYNTWATGALKAINGSAMAAGYQGNMIGNEMTFMNQMQNLISQPNGMDQSIQIGNAVSLETVAQLQKLRMLMIQDIGSRSAFTTTQINAQQTAQNAQSGAFTFVPFSVDTRGW